MQSLEIKTLTRKGTLLDPQGYIVRQGVRVERTTYNGEVTLWRINHTPHPPSALRPTEDGDRLECTATGAYIIL